MGGERPSLLSLILGMMGFRKEEFLEGWCRWQIQDPLHCHWFHVPHQLMIADLLCNAWAFLVAKRPIGMPKPAQVSPLIVSRICARSLSLSNSVLLPHGYRNEMPSKVLIPHHLNSKNKSLQLQQGGNFGYLYERKSNCVNPLFFLSFIFAAQFCILNKIF